MIEVSGTASNRTNANSQTTALTTDGENRELVVGVGEEQGASGNSVTGITYAGVAMTLVDKQQIADNFLNYWVYLYHLTNPALGNNNIIVSADEAINITTVASAYKGVKQSGQPDASGKATNASTTDLGVSLTVVATGCWIVSVGQSDNAPTAGSGLTSRVAHLNTVLADSNGTVSTGSNTVHWTKSPAGRINAIACSLSPAPAIGRSFGMIIG